MPTAPGSYVNVTAAPPSPNGSTPTGVWFVTGQTYMGPTGVAVPLTSMTDFINFLGPRSVGTNSFALLYDAMDEFFHDGGIQAYASRVVGPGAATAQVTVNDNSAVPTLTFKAVGAGSWGDNLSVVIASGTVAYSYTVAVYLNGTQVGSTTPNLFTPQDAVTWFASLNPWQCLVTVQNNGSATTPPSNNPATGTYTLTNGSDDWSHVTDTQFTAALTAFPLSLGPGQVSAPGHMTNTGYDALVNHAIANQRVAILDVADSPTASTLTAQASGVQNSVVDPSYGGLFGPWIILPGITSSTPGAASPIPNRVCPPSALVAAQCAANDTTSDANQAAAGPNGQSSYAIGVTQVYSLADRGTLNAAGVNIIQNLFGTVTIYGFQSLALDPNWVQLNWVRMRMQMEYELGRIADGYVFTSIDGKGQKFAELNGALAGRCQQYYLNNSLYGANSGAAFTVNTGPQVNTITTISNAQIVAQVLCRMSEAANQVIINVVKYLPSASLPA